MLAPDPFNTAASARWVRQTLVAHLADDRNWANKWRIAVLTLAVFAALC